MAFISIQTKFLGPTNYRGDRIKATSMQGFSDGKKPSVTIPYDYGLTNEENHREAATKLLPQIVNEYTINNVMLVAGGCDKGYIFTPIFSSND